ncbi:MAG: DNA recombination protein RmuC [Candidatus Shapirobacteria bacterium]|jgi:DNA recombination protein RmuC
MSTIFLIATVFLQIVLLYLFLTQNKSNRADEILKKIAEIEDRLGRGIKDEFSTNRQELSNSFKNFSDSQNLNFHNFGQKLDQLINNISISLNQVRESVEKRLESLQKDNTDKLEKMRLTVDEKLQTTLEKRLGESFKQVSVQLESVYKNLGEIKSLTTGVDTLNKVLTNIKTRGTWGEVQLNNLLEQILIPEQYGKNVAVKEGSNERVEFAIKLPGKNDPASPCWLPIDSKFPLEDYQRLLDVQKCGDLAQIDTISKALENRVKGEAKYIFDKYIDPPHTTDFAILYLPIEGLYAEVTQNQPLIDTIQRQFRVTVAGPNTITALLNSLQMGFRVLTVEKRSSEVWAVLGTVRKEFSLFGDLLDKTQKKLQEASNVITDASSKSRNIASRLNKVQTLSDGPELATPPPLFPELPKSET